MIKCHYVVDTGYLLELFKVPNHSNDNKHQVINNKFKQAAKEGFPVYIPVLVLFELANHIAQVADGHRRKELAEKLTKIVESCVNKQDPWIITPSKELESVNKLLETLLKFADEYSNEGIGLTDTSVALEAKRLSEKYRSFGHHVYIWTTDGTLKGKEPNSEKNRVV